MYVRLGIKDCKIAVFFSQRKKFRFYLSDYERVKKEQPFAIIISIILRKRNDISFEFYKLLPWENHYK
jgi:hypothetical protein